MIERRDCGDQAKRLAQRENLSRRPVLRCVAGEDALVVAQRLGGGKLEHLLRPAYFVAGLAHAQAGLESDQVCKLVRALGQQFAGSHEDFVALVFGRRLRLAKEAVAAETAKNKAEEERRRLQKEEEEREQIIKVTVVEVDLIIMELKILYHLL